MQRTSINVVTGEVTVVDLTPEEIAALPPPTPAPMPQEVAVWQFMTAAWRLGFITQQEALAAIKDKVMPHAFAQALSELPPEAQAEAQLKFAGITRMVRVDPLFALLVASEIVTDAQIDEVFKVAASIT